MSNGTTNDKAGAVRDTQAAKEQSPDTGEKKYESWYSNPLLTGVIGTVAGYFLRGDNKEGELQAKKQAGEREELLKKKLKRVKKEREELLEQNRLLLMRVRELILKMRFMNRPGNGIPALSERSLGSYIEEEEAEDDTENDQRHTIDL